MKTLYINGGSNICVDPETNSASRARTYRQGIDRIYVAEEPMHVVYNEGEYKKEVDVDQDDIIVTFYVLDSVHKMVIVKNDEWLENLRNYAKKEQEEKERWAQKNLCESESKA